MNGFQVGSYVTQIAVSVEDLAQVQALRGLVFRRGGIDEDAFDARCNHFVVRQIGSGEAVCCFRLMLLASGGQIFSSYSSQFYDLVALEGFSGSMAEIGRFCMKPGHPHPDILRAAWGALTKFVDDNEVEMLFGCSSFAGMTAETYEPAFALLKDRYLAPDHFQPLPKAARRFEFSKELAQVAPDLKAAMRVMPPLLRTYLSMGGWVSDHAVVDADLGTLHVFTGLEINAIPPARKRLLRALQQNT